MGVLNAKVAGEWVPVGGTSGGFYVHHQTVPAAVWSIIHGLPYNPNITVIDSAGDVVEGGISYSLGMVTLTHSAAFAGIAYLS